MTGISHTNIIFVLIAVCAIVLASCAPKTDEAQIRELMNEAGRHIENKQLSSLLDLLSDDYTDFRGRDKTQTKDMVQTYFREFRGIVVHLLSTQIDGIDLDRASLRTDAAISSGAVQALRKLVPVSTDNYRFQIELIKTQDRWMIRYAEWKHIGMEELFPESLSILKKLISGK